MWIQTANSIGGNSSGTLALVSSGTMTLAGGNNVTLSQVGNAITISAGAAGGVTLSSMELGAALAIGAIGTGSLGQNSLYFVPDNFPVALSALAIKIPVSMNYSSSATASCQVGYTLQLGVFTRATANTDSLSRAYSTSYTMSGSMNSNVSAIYAVNTGFANGTSYNVLTSSSGGDGISADIFGARELLLPISSLFPAGEYWFAYLASSSSVGAAGNLFKVSYSTNVAQVARPFQHSVNTALAYLRNIGLGHYTATTGVIPAAMAFSDISAAGGNSATVVRAFIVSATQ